MSLSIDIVSIGTLSRNFFWSETARTRSAHATTTLIRDGHHRILVDPSLPPELLRHRLDERTGLRPDQIDAVFLTNFSPVHRGGLSLFEAADWYISRLERDTIAQSIRALSGRSDRAGGGVAYAEFREELALIERLKPVPERLTPHVDWFPSYGATPGSSSLLVKAARTVVVAGDAVLGRAHFEHGRIWERSSDPEQAKESFIELRDIADVIVPGHDNIMWIA